MQAQAQARQLQVQALVPVPLLVVVAECEGTVWLPVQPVVPRPAQRPPAPLQQQQVPLVAEVLA